MRKKFFKKAVVVAMSVMMLGTALTVHAEDGVYTVKKGDNFSKIAKEVYGSREEWKTIYEANRGIIKNANILYAGQQLVLPMSAVSGRLSSIEYNGGYREGAADVTISNTASFGNPDYWVPLVPAAPAGYEWKEVDMFYVSDTLEIPSSHYYTTKLHMEGLGQAVTSTRRPADWTYTSTFGPDVYSDYEEYDFALNYNGVTYAGCKFYERCIKEIDDKGVLAMQVMLLLPKDYAGSVVYTVYGAKIVDNNVVKKEEESISFVIQ